MYEVRIQAHFQAEHSLIDRDGRQEPPHTHDWQVEAVFRGPELDEQDLLIDFIVVQKGLERVIAPLSGTNLNDAPFAADANPSAERIARYLFDELGEQLDPSAPLAAVYVREAPGCIAGFMPE